MSTKDDDKGDIELSIRDQMAFELYTQMTLADNAPPSKQHIAQTAYDYVDQFLEVWAIRGGKQDRP